MKRGLLYLGSVLLFLFTAAGTASAADLSKVALGSLLYFDTYLSLNHNQACASCHLPPGFADPRNAVDPWNNVVSLGSDETLNGGRNAPPSSYAAFSPMFFFDAAAGLYVGGQFWDGRAATLADQAKGPFLNPVEMGMPSKAAVLEALADRNNKNWVEYRILFKIVYDVKLAKIYNWDAAEIDRVYDLVADAIQAFEQTLFFSRFNSKFDYVQAGLAQFTQEEQHGFGLFNGKGKCALCHVSNKAMVGQKEVPALFTDFTYDNLGIPKSQNYLIIDNPVDLGLGAIVGDPAENGKFKVSSLRNIALTAPYGHNGYFATLEDIVHFYNTRDVAGAGWDPPEYPDTVNVNELGDLGLSASEEADLVAFLKTLSDGYGPPLLLTMPPLPY